MRYEGFPVTVGVDPSFLMCYNNVNSNNTMLAPAAALVVAGGILIQTWSPEHPGFDYACRTGQPVYATHSGTVRTSRSWRMGNEVRIITEDGTAYYAHLQSVRAEGEVLAGEVIGTCGNTGRWSYGPHVHYEFQQ